MHCFYLNKLHNQGLQKSWNILSRINYHRSFLKNQQQKPTTNVNGKLKTNPEPKTAGLSYKNIKIGMDGYFGCKYY